MNSFVNIIFSNKYYRFGITLFPILVISIILLCIKKPEINLTDISRFRIFEFSDFKDGGSSICKIKVENESIDVNFQLRKTYIYPYAGFILQNRDQSLFDIEGYRLKATIVASQDVHISVRINQFLDHYSDTTKPLSLLLMTKTIELKKGVNSFNIKTKDINEIPDWWYKSNPQKINGFNSISLKKTRNIWLFNDSFVPMNIPISYKVTTMKLVYDYIPWIQWSALFLIIYYLFLFVGWLYIRNKVKYIFMPIEATKVVDNSKNIKENLVTFFYSNYSNPELRLLDLANTLHVSEDKASDLLKQYTNNGFRQYLNIVRMDEAKRLLKETNLQIAEIAFKVGYGNIQHFNRVFKEFTNESPKNYREK
jgi:AraC-like DNA-binding protein